MKRAAVAICLTVFGCAELPDSAKKDSSKSEDGCSANASGKKASLMMRNGETASEEDFPFAGMLYAKNMRITVFPPLQVTKKSCSATLVCKNVVMTAAHWMDSGQTASLYEGFGHSVRPDLTGETGTGIGMLQVNNYLRLAGGTLSIQSRPEHSNPEDHGTTVKIFLPRASAGAGAGS